MADAKQAMNYEIYIQPHRLPEVRPRQDSTDPDEQFFIRTHQAFEIWFAQALAELEHARTLLAQPAPAYVPESDMPTIEQHVRRAAAIFDLVSQHLPLLETLKTTSFYNFRKSLFGASGTQSYRFRELEWLMGLLDKDLLDYTQQKLDLERNLTNPEATTRANEKCAAIPNAGFAKSSRERVRHTPTISVELGLQNGCESATGTSGVCRNVSDARCLATTPARYSKQRLAARTGVPVVGTVDIPRTPWCAATIRTRKTFRRTI